jgi:hypothetical protein
VDRKSPFFQRNKRGKSQPRRYDNQPNKPWRPHDDSRPQGFRPPGRGDDQRRQSPFDPPPSPPVVIIDRVRIEPFELFCALHLGITADGGYRPQSPAEVARRFGMSLVQLQGKAAEFNMDSETVRRSGFDVSEARYDIKVAPEGISRRELARPWYEEFLAAVAATPRRPDAVAKAEASVPVVELDLKNPIFED